MRVTRPILWSSLLLFLGCYSYAPTPIESIPSGARVRTRLTPVETVRVQDVLGTGNRLVEGVLIAEEDGVLVLHVPMSARGPEGTGRRLHQRLRIPRREVVDLELRRLDRWRTGLLVVAGAVVAGLVVADQFQGTGGTTDLPPGGGGPRELGPAIRLPVVIPGFR